jgi:hypothetical protein
MMAGRLLYRARQFWQALGATPHPEDLELAASVLTAPQLALFQQMPASDQAHGLRVLRALHEGGERDADLLTAALLHDAGKGRCPLRPWERALIVVAGAVCPACLACWGSTAGEGIEGAPDGDYGWRRPFVVAVQHPAWGAEMAAAAGASPQVVVLILRHQERLHLSGSDSETIEDRHLRALQAVDDNS